jgi:glycerophosphoryl diester phosphodiesterase
LSPFAIFDAWLSPRPDAEQVGWLREWRYAHRGLHGDTAPENSPSAFAAAVAAGLGIECDVQLTADKSAVVFHDAELGRLTGEQGLVAERNADDLSRIALTGSADTISTLRTMITAIEGRVPVLIEIKAQGRRRNPLLCLAVRRALEGYTGAVAVMSFDPRVVRWFADHSPLTLRGLVVSEEHSRGPAGRVRRQLSLWSARPDFLAYDVRDLPSAFAAAQRKRGLPLLTWTVRGEGSRERAAAYADAPIAEGAGIA